MFSSFALGMQQDVKMFLLPPLLCAVFRLIFILVYRPKKSPCGEWKKWLTCFRYGFWWGMDVNAYLYLVLLLLVSLPGAFLPAYFAVGDTIRLAAFLLYAAVLYTAFIGKMVFFAHFHDTFNPSIRLGKNADKGNLADIFFHQNHGAWLLLGYIPYLFLCYAAGSALLALPSFAYPTLVDGAGQYAVNACVFVLSIVFFYWLRYGGTLRHRQKPEWDEVPVLVKEDIFLGKATMDDLIAFERAWQRPVREALQHTDEESFERIAPLFPAAADAQELSMELFRHTAEGARIDPPRHIFYLVGESYTQALFDAPYRGLNLMEAGRLFRADPHTISINNFLSGGVNSRPSIVSAVLGIYDVDMELNEKEAFWRGTLPTSLPLQLKRLGYRTSYWYGGSLSKGYFTRFLPAAGFDAIYSATDICGDDAPQTWIGVYDHVFLEEAARRICAEKDDVPSLHLLYTTSNHGPYLIPFEKYGYNPERVMPGAPASLKKKDLRGRGLACAWYADQALCKFINEMRARYPDSLFIVTGDHAGGILPLVPGVTDREEPLLRERILTSFAIHHPQLTTEHLAGNTIGGHMNIMPTLIELIAPQGFSYYSIEKPLTERLDHVVTPRSWLTTEMIGNYSDRTAQELTVTAGTLPWQIDTARFTEERDAYVELTAYYVRHPELLIRKEDL